MTTANPFEGLSVINLTGKTVYLIGDQEEAVEAWGSAAAPCLTVLCDEVSPGWRTAEDYEFDAPQGWDDHDVVIVDKATALTLVPAEAHIVYPDFVVWEHEVGVACRVFTEVVQ